MLIPKPEEYRSEAHRQFIASLPCCVTGLERSTQCAHVRWRNGGGMSKKPSDKYCVPLSCDEHTRQGAGEVKFWGDPAIATKLALDLYAVSGDETAGWRIVEEFRRKYFVNYRKRK